MSSEKLREARWHQYFLGMLIAIIGFVVVALVKSHDVIQLAGLGAIFVGLYVMRRSRVRGRTASAIVSRLDEKSAPEPRSVEHCGVWMFMLLIVAILSLVISTVAVFSFDGRGTTVIVNVLSILLVMLTCVHLRVRRMVASFIAIHWDGVSAFAKVSCALIVFCGIVSFVSVLVIIFGGSWVYTSPWVLILFLCSFSVFSLACIFIVARWAIGISFRKL